MLTVSFNPKYRTKTPDGKTNFIGAVVKTFDEINGSFKDSTKNAYIGNYNDTIFPLINPAVPVEEYTEEMVGDLLRRIKEHNGLDDSTIGSRYRHLVFDPIEVFTTNANPEASLSRWGSAMHFRPGDGDIESALLVLKKSFTREESRKLEVLYEKTDVSGERVGLALMHSTGMRENEICGANFGFVFNLLNHPEAHCIKMPESTGIGSSALELGGKTSNAPRIIPLAFRIYDFLQRRADYLNSKLTFPIEDENGLCFESVNDLPVACRGDSFLRRCSTRDLSVCGTSFLRNEISFSENRVAGISELQRRAVEEDVIEADATTYLFRRNFSTRLYVLGFTELESKYLMGHKLDNPLFRRSDFSDEEYLYGMWKKLEKFYD